MAINRKPNEKDYITNKVLVVFSLCLLGVFGLMFLYRYYGYAHTYMTGLRMLNVTLGISAVGFLAGLALTAHEKKQKQDMEFRIIRGRNIAVVFAVIALILWFIRFRGPEAVKSFYIILPVLAVYYLIFHSYPREFFVVAGDCLAGAALLVLVRAAQATTNFRYVAFVAAVLAAALAAVQIAALLHFKKKGCYGMVDGKKVRLFTSAYANTVMMVTAVVMAALVLLGAVAGIQIAYYLFFVIFGFLFVTAVYYTVKMI